MNQSIYDILWINLIIYIKNSYLKKIMNNKLNLEVSIIEKI